MKKNKTVKIMAILALLGIVISVVGTGILILTSGNQSQEETTKINSVDLQKIIDKNKVELTTQKGDNK